MRIGKFLYYGDFVIIPVAILVLAAAAIASDGITGTIEWIATLAFGVVFWTLVEYLIHRFAYHHAPILSPLHDAHHREPMSFVGVPSFLSSGLILAVCYLPLHGIAPIVASGFTSGVMLGYAAYMFVHHAAHHFDIQPGDWLYEARLRHMAHHYREGVNFGVSVGFWDRVFGTTAKRRERTAVEA
jgi:sterol desaturase/sphingolipid hydroxylase (fatty acid hydroxylase superfamily)